jgi:hypothetical protein
MMSQAKTSDAYLRELPDDRRAAIRTLRDLIRENLPEGYEEGMAYGMINWFVPHALYPPGYHCNPKLPLGFLGLASQKQYMALYMAAPYYQGGDPGTCEEAPDARWFREAWLKTGKKLDMGKCCVRFKRLDDVPLEVVAKAIARVPVKKLIAYTEAVLGRRDEVKSAKKPAKKKPSGKAAATKRA